MIGRGPSTGAPFSDWGAEDPTGNAIPAAAACKSHYLGLLRRGVTQAGIDLFAAYGIIFTAVPPDADEGTPSNPIAMPGNAPPPSTRDSDVVYLAFAGFGGAHLSGFAILGMPESVLRSSNLTNSSLGDWTAELANQFLGRIKNRMLRDGLPIFRIPPAVVTGTPACLFLARSGPPPVTLANDNHAVHIWLHCEPGVEANDTAEQPQPDVMAEGEMVLF